MDDPVRHEQLDGAVLTRDGRFWELYEHSFPPAEKEPRDVIEKSVRLGCGLAFRSVLRGETVAMATAHILREVPALFLVYLAVDARRKGRGTGGGLLEFLHAQGCRTIPGGLGTVWEAERARDAATEPGKRIRERRLAFFHRHGGVLLTDAYRQPALAGG